jgi:UDP-N-acetylmuramoylalanine-D-glutamate ligase
MERLPTALKDCQSIGLVGLGCSNRGVLSHLEKCEEQKTILVRAEKETDCGLYSARFGKDYLRDIGEDALILSPAVRPDLAPLMEARRRGVRILSDAEIFFRSPHRLKASESSAR